MKLTDCQLNQFIAHFSQFTPGGCTCPVCGDKHWNVNDTLFQSLEFTGLDLKIGKGMSMLPFIVLTCNTCSYTMFFNAIKCGVLKIEDLECLVLIFVTAFSAIFAVACFIARWSNVKILYKNIDDVKLDIHDIELKLQHE